MIKQLEDDPNNIRMVQVGILHGGIDPCENDRYPGIYNRIDQPDILEWIKKKVFNVTGTLHLN